MSDERLVKTKVNSLFSQYQLSKVTLDNLIYIIEDQGFKIIEFESTKDLSSNLLLTELNIINYAKTGKAFTYQQGSAKFVFICEDMSAQEKLYALAHEVGHIFCLHLQDGNIEHSVYEEYEANEFAHYLLHPNILMKTKRWICDHKISVITAASIIFLIIIAVVIVFAISKSESYYGDYYITESGEKYHREDCIFIKDKKNVDRLTEKDYYSGAYDPCQICLPD